MNLLLLDKSMESHFWSWILKLSVSDNPFDFLDGLFPSPSYLCFIEVIGGLAPDFIRFSSSYIFSVIVWFALANTVLVVVFVTLLICIRPYDFLISDLELNPSFYWLFTVFIPYFSKSCSSSSKSSI